jgi:hypothetical protein
MTQCTTSRSAICAARASLSGPVAALAASIRRPGRAAAWNPGVRFTPAPPWGARPGTGSGGRRPAGRVRVEAGCGQWRPDYCSAAFRALVRRADLPAAIHVYTLRHSAASFLAAEGLPASDIAAPARPRRRGARLRCACTSTHWRRTSGELPHTWTASSPPDRVTGRRMVEATTQISRTRLTAAEPLADRFRSSAEASGYAHEPWCRVAEHLGHHTGVGTGQLRPMRVGRGQVSDTDDGKVLDDAIGHDRSDGPMMVGHKGGVGAGRAAAH